MSMEQMELIETRLGIDKQPITAISLSRKWLIPAKTASEYMLQFYNKHKDDESFKDLSIKYSICGKQKCNDKRDDNEIKGERHADVLIKIVDKNELDNTIKNVYSDIISCQIYSMQLKDTNISISNIINICAVPNWKYSDENMVKCGILRTKTNGVVDDAQIIEDEIEEVKTTFKTQPEPVKPVKTVKKEVEHLQEKGRPVYVSRKAASNATPAPEVKKPVYVSRKRQSPAVEEHKIAPPLKKTKTISAAQQKKLDEEKRELEKMLEEDGFSDDNFSDGVVANEKETQAPDQYKYDDIDLADPEERIEIIETKKDVESKPATKDVEDLFSDDDEILNDVLTEKEEPANLAEVESKPEVETYTDADGYVVSVKKHNPAPAKPTPKSSSAASEKRNFTIETKSEKEKEKSASRKQSSLMSFFKKK